MRSFVQCLMTIGRMISANRLMRSVLYYLVGILPKSILPNRLVIEIDDSRKLIVNPRNESHRMITFCGTYDPLDSSIVRDLVNDGDTVFDVGANLGWYTTLIGKRIGPHGSVVGIEPLPSVFSLLKKNISLNELENVILLNKAVAGKTESGFIHLFEGEPDTHASIKPLGRTKLKRISIQLCTIDSIINELDLHPNFVKIDVEGAEMELLDGAISLLSETRPIIMLEVHFGTAKDSGHSPLYVLNRIRQFDYVFFQITGQRRLRKLSRRSKLRYVENLICVPFEKQKSVFNTLSLSEN
ncbi:MAG: FkbM family methyltransferase [Candidatus Thorarchaeota archaeon]